MLSKRQACTLACATLMAVVLSPATLPAQRLSAPSFRPPTRDLVNVFQVDTLLHISRLDARNSAAQPRAVKVAALDSMHRSRGQSASRGLLIGALVGGAIGCALGSNEEYGGAAIGTVLGAAVGAPVGMIIFLLTGPTPTGTHTVR